MRQPHDGQRQTQEGEALPLVRLLRCGHHLLQESHGYAELESPMLAAEHAGTLEEAEAAIQRGRHDIVLVDLDSVPSGRLVQSVRRVLKSAPHTAMILVSTEPDSPDAARFIRAGGYDVAAPDGAKGQALNAALRRARDRAVLLSRLEAAEDELARKRKILEVRDWVESSVLGYPQRTEFQGLIGASEQMQELYERIERLAARPELNVAILAERGTGKSLVARALHNMGPRDKEPFLKFLCSRFQSADPKITMCELFGWGRNPPVRDLDRRGGEGVLEQARGGTIFLDELGDIPVLGQNLLLDVVETRSFRRPIGEAADVSVEARFVFATNRPPRELLESGVLRADFWDRISEAILVVPPLRQRTEDIPLLVRHFVQLYNQRFRLSVDRFTKDAVERLRSHAWPGNVRELESTVKRALVLSSGGTVDVRDLEIHLGDQRMEPLEALVERLWGLIESGHLHFSDVVQFKLEWGREITRRLVRRAVTAAGSVKAAGVTLGVYEDADQETARYAKFRSDVSRIQERHDDGAPARRVVRKSRR